HPLLQGTNNVAVIKVRAPAIDKQAHDNKHDPEEEEGVAMESDTGFREKSVGTPGTMHSAGVWPTYESAAKNMHGPAVHQGVLTSTIFQEPEGDGDAASVDLLLYPQPIAMRSKAGVAPSVASSAGATTTASSSSVGAGRSVTGGWFSNSLGRTKGKAAKTPVSGNSAITPFNLDATIPKAVSGAPAGAMKAPVTVNVHYPADDVWRVVVFPPGVLVDQARDICMLKFNVWHRIMEREQLRAKKDEDEEKERKQQSKEGAGGGTTRDHYGLYWPSHAQWLDTMGLLSSYGLAADDVLELQDARSFVDTGNQAKTRRRAANSLSTTTVVSSTVIEPRKAEPEESLLRFGALPLLPTSLQGRGSTTTLERKLSLAPPPLSMVADAEGRLHYLHGTGISTAWKLFWVELHGSMLVCFKKKPTGSKPKPLLVIELSKGFRVVSPASQASDTSSISTGTLSSTSSMSITTSTGLSDTSLLGTIASSHKQLGASSVPLIIKCNAGASSGSQVH
ncbi:hypothetical protein LPJ59_004246, partial [Coemansia sp. RSA 2399]